MTGALVLRLPCHLGDTLIAEAARAGGAEICGFITTDERMFIRYIVTNQAGRPAEHFDMDPGDQIAAFKQIRAAGARLLAIYHSHPAGEAVPSIHDIRGHSYPETAILIAAPAAANRRNRLRAWRFDDRQPRELSLEWTGASWRDGFRTP